MEPIVIQDTATPMVRSVMSRVSRPQVVMEGIGKAAVQTLKDHFKGRQGEGNRHGWPEHHFWYGVKNSVANATAVSESGVDSVTVAIADHRFAHKVTGGRIVPKRGEALTIPLNAKAYALSGKGSVRESQPDLFILRTRKGVYLVRSAYERRSQAGKWSRVRDPNKSPSMARQRLEFWFKLVKGVTQQADPRALPPQRDLAQAAERAAKELLPLLLKPS